MELALSLGDGPKPFQFLDKNHKTIKMAENKSNSKDVGMFCMGLGTGFGSLDSSADKRETRQCSDDDDDFDDDDDDRDPPVQQLNLLPLAPVHRTSSSINSHLPFPWLADNLMTERGSSEGQGRGLDVNRLPGVGVEAGEDDQGTEDKGADMSSPNSAVSSFQMDIFVVGNGGGVGGGGGRNKRDMDQFESERASSRASDDEENGSTRKKLRLSKEQSAFLEESFKEHSTLNPKQKLALAKQLNLRPRQVEVWFQNRRARTKLKQTEVDCEYLKRCCETLTEENRRLQKELQELRALKTSQPFYMQLPATTLTMCPSCERVATTTTTAATATATTTASAAAATKHTTCQLGKPIIFPYSSSQTHQPAS